MGLYAKKIGLARLCLLIIFPTLTISQLAQAHDQTVLHPDQYEFTADGILLIDVKTGKILYDKNKHQPLYPASITKGLTALMALEYGQMDDIVITSEKACYLLN